MKTILVPTDFSDNAANVIEYAAQLAKHFDAKLMLFHVYHPPVTISEISEAVPMEHIEAASLKNMEGTAKELKIRHGQELDIECKAQCGFAVDEIRLYEESHPVDLVVMGMKGAGYLSERLVGSITTSVLYRSKSPVLAIGEKVRFKPIQKIAFACHFAQANHTAVQPLVAIAKLFGAHIHLLHVGNEPGKWAELHESPAGIELENALQGTEHSIHHVQNADIVDGINDFVHAQNMDLVVMVPRTHSFLEKIFQEPNTKRMAFHSDVPLLAIHEAEKP